MRNFQLYFFNYKLFYCCGCNLPEFLPSKVEEVWESQKLFDNIYQTKYYSFVLFFNHVRFFFFMFLFFQNVFVRVSMNSMLLKRHVLVESTNIIHIFHFLSFFFLYCYYFNRWKKNKIYNKLIYFVWIKKDKWLNYQNLVLDTSDIRLTNNFGLDAIFSIVTVSKSGASHASSVVIVCMLSFFAARLCA